jgi:hypothetical protein
VSERPSFVTALGRVLHRKDDFTIGHARNYIP